MYLGACEVGGVMAEALDDDMQSIWVRSVFELLGRSRS